jgi:hypothetical protein
MPRQSCGEHFYFLVTMWRTFFLSFSIFAHLWFFFSREIILREIPQILSHPIALEYLPVDFLKGVGSNIPSIFSITISCALKNKRFPFICSKRISATPMSCCFRCRKTLRTFHGVVDTLFLVHRFFFVWQFFKFPRCCCCCRESERKKEGRMKCEIGKMR